MIDLRSAQYALQNAGFYDGKIDGLFGRKSFKARADMLISVVGSKAMDWPESRQRLALDQWIMKSAGIETGAIDGLNGPQTRFAYTRWDDLRRDIEAPKELVAHQPTTWPRQRAMAAFYGAPGTNHTKIDVPFPLRIAWDKSKSITRFTINEKCAESAVRAYTAIFDHYGYEKIKELGLDLWGGCYNNRKMRGGSSLSTHAFACAIDGDPEHNQLHWRSDRASLATPERSYFLDAWEAQGWISLGRERNMDWMHVQAARL